MIAKLFENVHEDLNKVALWFESNDIQLSPTKRQAVIFTLQSFLPIYFRSLFPNSSKLCKWKLFFLSDLTAIQKCPNAHRPALCTMKNVISEFCEVCLVVLVL